MPKLRQHQIDARNALLAQGLLHCPKCSTTKPVDDFGKKSSRWSGRQEWCKPCRAEYRRTYKYDPAATAKRRQEQAELRKRDLKVCSKCGHLKCRSAYNRNTKAADGLYNYCRSCNNAATAGWDARAKVNDPYYIRLRNGYMRAGAAGLPHEWFESQELFDYWESQGIDPWVCVFTGEKLTPETAHWDHLNPLSDPTSPGHVKHNIVPTSASANISKGKRSLIDFLADRAEAGKYGVDPETRDALLGVTVTNTEAVQGA